MAYGPGLSRLGCGFVSLMLSASKETLSLPSFLSAEDKGMGYGALEELSVRNSLATASAAGVVRVRELTFLFLRSVSPWPCSDVASSVVEAVQIGTPLGAPLPVHDLRLGWEGAMSSRPCMRPGVEASSLVTSGHSWCAPSAQNPSPSSFPTGPPPHSLLTPTGGEHGLPSLTVRGGSPHALRAVFLLLFSCSLPSSPPAPVVSSAGRDHLGLSLGAAKLAGAVVGLALRAARVVHGRG